MSDSEEIKRRYYTIAQVGNIINVTPSCVRYWCSEFGLESQISRKSQNRKFTEKNLNDLIVIEHLIRTELYTLEGARRKFAMWKDGEYEIPGGLFDKSGTDVKDLSHQDNSSDNLP